MSIVTTVSNSSRGVKMMLGRSMEEEIVIVPLSRYESLLQQVEDLKDIQDHYNVMEEYRMGEGRPFREFMVEYEEEFDLQS
ncbi:MAG: hypothetical protein V2A53_01050 [bacterium]